MLLNYCLNIQKKMALRNIKEQMMVQIININKFSLGDTTFAKFLGFAESRDRVVMGIYWNICSLHGTKIMI